MRTLFKILPLLGLSHCICAYAANPHSPAYPLQHAFAAQDALVLKKSTAAPLMQPSQGTELSVFLGAAQMPNALKGQSLQLLPYEIGPYADTFRNQSSARALTFGLAGAYRFKAPFFATHHAYFDSVAAGLQFFQSERFNQNGTVLQFNLPEFENYSYKLGLKNSRIMADVDLDFNPLGSVLIPFLEGGIGAARTEISYSSNPISPVEGPQFVLHNERSWHFAYQAGAGLKYALGSDLVLSLRYLYANMGEAHSSTLGNLTNLAAPLSVDVSTQNVLLGLTYLMH